MKRRILHAPAEGPTPALGPFLRQALGLSGGDAERLVTQGAVYVAGRRCREPAGPLSPGAVVTVVLEERGQSTLLPPGPAAVAPRVLHEDKWLLVVDKPAGMPSQPTPGGAEPSVLGWAAAHLEEEPGLVHRLDRETSGVMLFGKGPEATRALAGHFREGAAHKRYLAVVGPGLSASGKVELPLSKDPSRPGRFRASARAHGVPAVTCFERVGETGAFCLVALYPRTGRTHQLRAHLTALGHPIAGDRRYGGAAALGGLAAPRCLLHAHALRLPHPGTGEPSTFLAPVPADMASFFDAAGARPPTGFGPGVD